MLWQPRRPCPSAASEPEAGAYATSFRSDLCCGRATPHRAAGAAVRQHSASLSDRKTRFALKRRQRLDAASWYGLCPHAAGDQRSNTLSRRGPLKTDVLL